MHDSENFTKIIKYDINYKIPKSINHLIIKNEIKRVSSNDNVLCCIICGDTKKMVLVNLNNSDEDNLHFCNFCYNIQVSCKLL